MNASPPKVQTPGCNRGGTNQNTDAQIIGAASICGKPVDADREVFNTLTAQLALRGYAVYEIESGFFIARWDRTLHCSDLAQVRVFLDRIGGGAA